jgi:hypothetical protein
VDALSQVPLADVRDIVSQTRNYASRQKQISPEDRLVDWEIYHEDILAQPTHIVVFDDVVAGGSHFAAMKMGLARRFPGVPVSGVFLARRVVPDPVSALDLLL